MTTKKQLKMLKAERKKKIQEMVNQLTPSMIADMHIGLSKSHVSLVKFLYDNYKPILREWEATQGKLRIEFLSSTNNFPANSIPQIKSDGGEFMSSKSQTNNEQGNYKCGHKSAPVILNDNEMSISAYWDWKDSTGWNGNKSQCWKCYCNAQNKDYDDTELKPFDNSNDAGYLSQKKGCGKEFTYLNNKKICGQIEDLKHSDNILLCDECKENRREEWEK